MMPTADMLHSLGAASWPVFWLPLVIWTVIALPVWGMLHLWKTAPPLVHYRARQALLFALPLGLGLAVLIDVTTLLPPPVSSPMGHAGESSSFLLEAISISTGATTSWSLFHFLGLMTLLAGGLALWQGVQLVRHAVALTHFRRGLSSDPAPSLQQEADRLAARLDLRRSVGVVIAHHEEVVPMTFGLFHPRIVLPADLAQHPAQRRLALLHELIHIRRFDYVAQWTERLASTLFAIHPGVVFLRRAIAALRERACDARVLTESSASRTTYARLLYAVATKTYRPQHGMIGMISSSTLKQRIKAMNTSFSHPPFRTASIAGTLLLGIVFLVAACSDLIESEEPSSATETQDSKQAVSTDSTKVHRSVEHMPELQPNQQTAMKKLSQCATYTDEARHAGVEGRIVIQFVVDEQGQVTNPRIVNEGLGAGLDERAISCVRKLDFQPGQLADGTPVKVQFGLPIRFRLPDEGSS